jgi:hypothetical protein
MTSAEQDWGYLETSLPELENYLLSNELFWPLAGADPSGRAWPRLTIGGLMLARRRLEAQAGDHSLQYKLSDWDQACDHLRAKWRVAWEDKAAREFSSRLRQWSHFLEEMRKDPENQRGYYPYEVRLRVIIHLLQQESSAISPEQERLLGELDNRLKARFSRGDFLWEMELAPVFPEPEFWYLWGSVGKR